MRVTEKNIEQALTLLEQGKFDADLDEDFWSEYFSETEIELISDEARCELEFLLQAILQSFKIAGLNSEFDINRLSSANEKNWKEFQNDFNSNLDDYINQCFENSEEEELLALIEDNISDENADKDTAALIWINMYTLINSLN